MVAQRSMWMHQNQLEDVTMVAPNIKGTCRWQPCMVSPTIKDNYDGGFNHGFTDQNKCDVTMVAPKSKVQMATMHDFSPMIKDMMGD